MSEQSEMLGKLMKALEDTYKAFPIALEAAYKDGFSDGSKSKGGEDYAFAWSDTRKEIDSAGPLL